MDERGRSVFVLDRQRDLGLDAVDRFFERPVFVGRASRMHDSTSGRNPVHVAGHDLLAAAEAVVMQERTLEQISDGSETDISLRGRGRRVQLVCCARGSSRAHRMRSRCFADDEN